MSIAPRSARVRRDWGADDSGTPILHVDMDSFFASVEVAEDSTLRGRPLIVGGRGNRGVVTSCTYDVRALGVHAGMPINQARARAPHALCLEGNRDLYREYSHKIMELLGGITVAVEPLSIDEAFLDVSGAWRRLGTPRQIAVLLRAQIHDELRIPASVGIGNSKTVAKIASSQAKPDGLLLVPASVTVEFLHSLPVGALPGIGQEATKRLTRLGIDTIKQLACLTQPELASVVGQSHSHRLREIIWGRDDRPVIRKQAEKSISTEETFAENVVERQRLEKYLLKSAHDCATRLRKKGLVARTVRIKLRDNSFRTITRSVTLSAATDTGRDIGRAALALFENEPIPGAGIRLAGVGVQNLSSREEGVQIPLGGDQRPLAAEKAMDVINHRFGESALTPATLLNSYSESTGRKWTNVLKIGQTGNNR